MYEYTAHLARVVDADTYILDIDLGCDVWLRGQRIRAAGINAPELTTMAGRTAREWAQQWFAERCPDGVLMVRTTRDRADNYGRLLGTIIAPGGACLNTDLLAAGLAVVYPPVAVA